MNSRLPSLFGVSPFSGQSFFENQKDGQALVECVLETADTLQPVFGQVPHAEGKPTSRTGNKSRVVFSLFGALWFGELKPRFLQGVNAKTCPNHKTTARQTSDYEKQLKAATLFLPWSLVRANPLFGFKGKGSQ